MINKTTAIIICSLLLTASVFGQGRKLTRQEIEVSKERDMIKSSGIKSSKTFEQDYDSLSNTFTEKILVSQKEYDNNGNMITSLSFDNSGEIGRYQRFKYDEKNNEIYRLDSNKTKCSIKTTIYKDDYPYQNNLKSGNTNSQFIYEYKFSKDGLILSKKMMTDKSKALTENIYVYDKTNKITEEKEKHAETGDRVVYKYDVNENISEYCIYLKDDGENPYHKEISEYDDNGLLISRKIFMHGKLSNSYKLFYQDGELIKTITFNADGSTLSWITYRYDDKGTMSEMIFGVGSHPISKSVYEYEYYK